MYAGKFFFSMAMLVVGLSICTFVNAAPTDVAPLNPETVAKIRKATLVNKRSIATEQASIHLGQLTEVIEKGGAESETVSAKNGKKSASPSSITLLDSKVVELRTTKDQTLREIEAQQAKLGSMGFSGAAKKLEEKKREIEDRFKKLEKQADRVRRTEGAENKNEWSALRGQLEALQAGQKEAAPDPKKPITNFQVGRQRPPEDRIPSPVVPAYINDPAKALPRTSLIVPAALSEAAAPAGPGCTVTAADLDKNTIEAKVTPEIAALANQLGYSPTEIFQYVSNNIRFEPYWGSLKGAQGTLVAGSGGPMDQASLLVALMREANIPARYVRGTIGFYNHGSSNPGLRWLGAKTFKAAADILIYNYYPNSPNLPLNAAQTEAIGIEFSHVWVEVCVPYSNYRGAQADNSGPRWIPLDASYKDNKYQSGRTHDVVFNYNGYLSKRTIALPHEAYAAQVEARSKYWSIEDVPYKATQQTIQYDILPASLPYAVVSYDAWDAGLTAETAVIPDVHRYKFFVDLKNQSDTPLITTQSFWMSDIALKRLSLGWQGATPTDQSMLDAWKNQALNAGLPCAAVNLKPEIRLDGALQAVGTGAVDICTTTNHLSMRIEVGTSTGPWVVSEIVQNKIGAASVYALHAHAFQTSNRLLKERAERLLANVQANPTTPNQVGDEILAEFLHLNLLKWMRYTNDAAKLVADLDGAYPGVGLHLGITGSQMKVDYSFGVPFAVHRTGYLIDVPAYYSSPVDLITGDLSWKTFLLAGYSASAFEHYIWQETAGLDAISTVRGIQFARENNIEVLTLTSANWATESLKLTTNAVGLNYSQSVVDMLYSNYVQPGGQVTLPRSLIQYSGKTGAVYLGELNVGGTNLHGPQGIQRADFNIEGFSGGFTIDDLMLFGRVGQNELQDLGFNINYLKEHDEYWGYPATTSSAALINNFMYLNSFVNTGLSRNPSNVGSSTNTSNVGSSTGCDAGSGFDNYVFAPDYFDEGAFAGDPVNTVTGNMYLNQRDLLIKGRCGLHLSFDRHYNSLMPKNGPLGFGWTHTYNHYLMFVDNNSNGVVDAADTDNITSSVIWVDSTGAFREFIVPGSAAGVPVGSSFQAAPGLNFKMERQSDGSYIVREKSGLVYKFENLAGQVGQLAKLTAITDRKGNALTMNYVNGNLSAVTDSLSRSLSFTYGTGGRISDIKDWTNRQHHYDYDAYGNLVTYKNPLAVKGQQQPTTYEYYADGAVDVSGALSPRNHAMKRFVLPRGNGETFEYYMNGRVFKEYNALGETNTFTYNPYRRETVMMNTRGFVRSFVFDPNGNPIEITAENGGVKKYTYDCLDPSKPAGSVDCPNPFHKTASTDAENRSKAYVYDAQGNVTQLTKYNSAIETYSNFNAYGVPGLVIDSNGNVTGSKFDAKGNILETIVFNPGYGANYDPATYIPQAAQIAQWTIYTYDTFGNLVTTKRVKDVASKSGPTETYAFDAQGLNTNSITRSGFRGDATIGTESVLFKYDALGRVITGVDDSWHPTQASYDELDRVAQATDKRGILHIYAYDANGNLLSDKINTGNKIVTERTYAYDLADRKISETDSGGHVTTFAYDTAGNLIKKTNPDGVIVSYEYDEHDSVVRELDINGNATAYQRDKFGRVLQTTDPNGIFTFQTYDLNGKLNMKTESGGPQFSYAYDGNGNMTNSWSYPILYVVPNDFIFKTTETQFDALNRPTRNIGTAVTIDGQLVHPVTRYTYDTLGNVVKIEMGSVLDSATLYDPSNDVITTQATYTWDDFGHRLSKTDANGKTVSYRYDRYGNLNQTTDARGTQVFYTWAYGHQLACISQSAPNPSCATNANLLKKYTRDYFGQVIQAFSPNVTYSYAYDASHRVSSVTDSRASKSITYSWSDGGRLDRLATNDGQIVDYQYDSLGRLTGIWAPNGDYVTLSWDAGGRLIEKWFPNGVNTQFSYNRDNNSNSLKQVRNRIGYSDANLISQHEYTYDGFGNRYQHTENIGGTTLSYTYLYDDLMRLISVDNGNPAQLQTNAYDIYNNRKSQLTGNVAAPSQAAYFQYDGANQLIATHSGSATGPLTAAFVYDENGNLTQHCQGASVTGSATSCSGSISTQSVFDVLNRISQVTRTGQPSQTYAYDDQDRRIRKTIGAAANDYIYQGQDILVEYANGWTAPTGFITHGAAIDIPLIWEPAANDPVGPRYFHQDGLNSVVAATDITGQSTTQRYDAWGNLLASTGQIPLYGYTGREQDGLGYTYYRARFYDPSVGRFTQRDPIELQGGINLYAYVNGNPVNFTDPTGLNPGMGGGTESCAFYDARCNQSGGTSTYYCTIAPTMCQITPPSDWTRCVRKCLQDFDQACSRNSDGTPNMNCVATAHAHCWTECPSPPPSCSK